LRPPEIQEGPVCAEISINHQRAAGAEQPQCAAQIELSSDETAFAVSRVTAANHRAFGENPYRIGAKLTPVGDCDQSLADN
jgi:hypothetical protein